MDVVCDTSTRFHISPRHIGFYLITIVPRVIVEAAAVIVLQQHMGDDAHQQLAFFASSRIVY